MHVCVYICTCLISTAGVRNVRTTRAEDYLVINDQLILAIYSNDMRHSTDAKADKQTLSIIVAYHSTHCTKHQCNDILHCYIRTSYKSSGKVTNFHSQLLRCTCVTYQV